MSSFSGQYTPDTKRLIGKRELDRIKRGALLVNVARGKLVDDDAVIEALRDGRLGGAALDVFSEEPLDPASPYWDLPNVIITPHTSGAMQDFWTPLVALFADNLRRFEKGSRSATSWTENGRDIEMGQVGQVGQVGAGGAGGAGLASGYNHRGCVDHGDWFCRAPGFAAWAQMPRACRCTRSFV